MAGIYQTAELEGHQEKMTEGRFPAAAEAW
jgi:hypothetical protein